MLTFKQYCESYAPHLVDAYKPKKKKKSAKNLKDPPDYDIAPDAESASLPGVDDDDTN